MSIRQLQKVGRWLKQEINIKNKLDMKIIAKQGSALEKLLKQMNERLMREQNEAKDMIQEVMHEETGRYFHWLPLEKDGIYYVSVGSSLLECMPSAKSEQFEIEV